MATVEQPLGEEIEQVRRQVVVHFWRWLGLITASALALRLLVVILSRHEKVTGDGYEWAAQGNLNAAGHWFVSPFTLKPDALRPPAWAMVLTIWAWFGQHSSLSQQVLGCLIGSVTVLLVGLCGRQLVGTESASLRLVSRLATQVCGLYERAILSETLLLPEIALFILLVYRFRENPTLRVAAVLGGMSGLMAVTRSEQVLTFPLVVLPAILGVNRHNWRRAVAWLVVAAAVLVLLIVPWTIFNVGRFDRPVLLSNGFGPAVATGNCGPAYYGPDIGYGEVSCLYPYYTGDQSVVDSKYVHNGLRYAENHASRLPLVVFAREGRAFGFWNPFQQTTIDAQWMSSSVGSHPSRHGELLAPAGSRVHWGGGAPPATRPPVSASRFRGHGHNLSRSKHRRPALPRSRRGASGVARGGRDRSCGVSQADSFAALETASGRDGVVTANGCRSEQLRQGRTVRVRLHLSSIAFG